jgi:RNA polymerase sigma-70 factor, ECF subfamily
MLVPSDALLIQAAKAGPDGFASLYEHYYPAIFAFAYSRTGEQARAEDVAAQTFLQAIQAIGRYQDRGVPLVRWLVRIAANVITEGYRRQPARGSVCLADSLLEAILPDPDDVLSRWEQAQDMAALLASLTPDQREVITLRFKDDMKVAQIAAATGRSEGAVKMLLMRALTALRGQLSADARPAAGRRLSVRAA